MNPIDREAYAIIRDVSRQIAFKLSIDGDDLAQDLWLLFDQRLRDEYDRTRPLRPYLAECARRVGLAMTHRRSAEVNVGSFSDSDGEEDFFSSIVSEEEDLVSALDRARALSKVGDCLHNGGMKTVHNVGRFADLSWIPSGLGQRAAPKVVAADAAASPPAATRERSVDQKELRSIRVGAGMTLEAFALAIGITEASLRAYEYGRTKGVPAAVMQRARDFQANLGAEVAKREQIVSRPIADVLADWSARLGVANDPAVLAEALAFKVSGNTLRRWLRGIHDPTPALLVELDDLVRLGPNAAFKLKIKNLLSTVRVSSVPSGSSALVASSVLLELDEVLRKLAERGGGDREVVSVASGVFGQVIESCRAVEQDGEKFLVVDQMALTESLALIEDTLIRRSP